MKIEDKQNIRTTAIMATGYIEAFNQQRKTCEHHAKNQMTKAHNCFHNNTKTKCDHILCPFKDEKL